MKILIQEDKEIKKAHKVYTNFTQDEQMLELYEAREKFKKDYNSIMAAKIEEAEKKGSAARAKKIAIGMLDEGIEINLIVKVTGLEKEEILALQKETG